LRNQDWLPIYSPIVLSSGVPGCTE
jgi:hypothetical protein